MMQPGMQQQQMVVQGPGMMMPQQQMMVVQQPMMVQGGGLAVLASLPGVYISQKENIVEALTGIQLPHKFNFYPLGPDDNSMPTRIFRGNDQSDPFLRQMMSPEDRPFQMYITMTNGPMDIFNFMYLERPSACCQMGNGVMRVYCLEGGQRLVGEIRGPCTFCNYELNIFGADGKPLFTFDGTWCQKGILCAPNCPCDMCQVSFFEIRDPVLQPIGGFKRVTNFCSRLFTNNDNYVLRFPPSASVDDKMLMMGALVLWDFVYFETPTPQEQQNQMVVY